MLLARRSAEKFDVLNAHIRNSVVAAGEIVIVGDHSTSSCTAGEAEFMQAAIKAHQELVDNDAGGDDFIAANHGLVSRLLGNASIGVGMAVDAWAKNMEEIKITLDNIDALHKQHMAKGTLIERSLFYTKRRQLCDRLEKLLKGILSLGAGLRNTGSIRRMLGISTKSYLHTGEIRNYADKIDGVARAAKYIKRGGYIGVVLDTTSTAVEINAACTSGRESDCHKAAFVERGKLAGSLGGGAFGGYLGGIAATAIYVTVLGLATGPGALACVVVTGAAGGWAGGEAGGALGELIGQVVYEAGYE